MTAVIDKLETERVILDNRELEGMANNNMDQLGDEGMESNFAAQIPQLAIP
jgi:hypothetical protein